MFVEYCKKNLKHGVFVITYQVKSIFTVAVAVKSCLKVFDNFVLKMREIWDDKQTQISFCQMRKEFQNVNNIVLLVRIQVHVEYTHNRPTVPVL